MALWPSFPLFQVFTRFVPSLDKRGNLIRDLWERMSAVPGGKRGFSLLVGRVAPYTGSIGARVETLRLGYCHTELRDRPSIRNHIRSVHAVALANLVELTGNLAVAYALDDDARFIVKGMSIDYVKKSRGTLHGECECPAIEGATERDYEVPVTIRDEAGDVTVRGTLLTRVGPKRP